MLIVAGAHVPEMPLVEVRGSASGVAPTQYGPSWVNTGAICASTTTVMAAVVAHCPAAGVKVYTAEPAAAVLIVAGAHVPVMPFVEVSGSASGVAPTQ